MTPNIPMAPAPWHLTGRGWLFLYRMPIEAEKIPELLPRESAGPYLGGLSALMLVDYSSSDVGPYQELLFIPGRFGWQDKKYYGISRIWVSSEASVVNGQENWGIPKEFANFSCTRNDREEIWSVKKPDGSVFFQATLKKGRLPFPMHTSLLPFPLLQSWKNKLYQTNFKGRGWARFGQMEKLQVQGDIFPDITAHKPLFGMAIDPFRIQFPVAKMLTASAPLTHRAPQQVPT